MRVSNPPVGAIAYGHSGIGYPVLEIEGDRLILQASDGLKRVPWGAVIRWELPDRPNEIEVGSRVQLKNTLLRYTVLGIFEQFAGFADDKPIDEQWAKLQTNDGQAALWKLNQLEVIATGDESMITQDDQLEKVRQHPQY